ncbi:uncharacterized protein N7484_009980 [Penicillium longicatenatum]|uniref:uncharacterized protein n=1 Tax=Penicillium longicatenatum TaxID=1561947 RepID=UPI002548DFEA|nr:uncharacterized protein N7484_009980 [Penicillium longicatenatum]KAJ5636667.1 hypothetical protein N7484_009980 [Penicillium longicatenatum]
MRNLCSWAAMTSILATASAAALPSSERDTCTGPIVSSPTTYWLLDQDHTGNARGYAPEVSNANYPVWRNVQDYSAVTDGSGDQTSAIQHAINDDGSGGSRKGQGVTRYPAEVFLPGGTYQLGSALDLRVGTVITGDPLNPPVLKASSDFDGDTLINGYDSGNGAAETSFMTLLRNVVIDTTALSADTTITALQTQGGKIGIKNSNQQVNFKNIYFKYCTTAFEASGGHTVLLQGATFDTVGLGIDMSSNGLGSMVLLDSKSTNSGTVIKFHDSSNDSGNRNSQLLIQNLAHDTSNPIAVDSNNNEKLGATDTIDTWMWGNVTPGQYQTSTSLTTSRSEVLLSGGKYFTRSQPTYADYASDQIVNVKNVGDYPVKGDGSTNDVDSLNAILAENAANCKITYFPYGVYHVEDTLKIPIGSRIMGEAWAVISGVGDVFKDASNPKAVVQVGQTGDEGIIEIQNIRFSVAEVLPGAIILEVNAAGTNPGDVGLWNTLVTVGGTAETSIKDDCDQQDTSKCMAAFMAMHLTTSSSAYIENFWAWTADHNLDGGSSYTVISTGRGVLVEATKGTWLTGTGSEHNWLYNYNFHSAQNVYAGMLQTESPYMQGDGATQIAPAPWTAESAYGDLDFSWCDGGDQKCRTSLATNVDGGKDVFLYNSAAWAFFNGEWTGDYSTQCDGSCQTNMMRVANGPENLVWYSVSTRKTDIMILDDESNPTEEYHPGGWEAIIQAYRQFSS